jgi:hypothetical protein
VLEGGVKVIVVFELVIMRFWARKKLMEIAVSRWKAKGRPVEGRLAGSAVFGKLDKLPESVQSDFASFPRLLW